jgi:hypothetical protein
MVPSPRHNDGKRKIRYCEEDPIDVFPEMKMLGLVPIFHIHVSESDLCILMES